MPKVRVMHYMNQFFAGKGGEGKADVPVGSIEGAVGPGKRLQEILGDSAEIVVTAYCGDDYFASHHDEALTSILKIARDNDISKVVAGPAFGSGRHGVACAEVCHAASNSLGLDTAMHLDNPGIQIYKQYKDRRVFALPTKENVAGMEEALGNIAKFVSKLSAGSVIGKPIEEGYIPRGFRLDMLASKRGAERAIDMLLNRLAGQPFTSEIPIETIETIPVAPRIIDLASAHIALATSMGIIKQGNPDGFKTNRNSLWRKYSVDKLDTMKGTGWDVIHGGYNNDFARSDPNYAIPLDAAREMKRDGIIGMLYPYFYMTSGCNGATPIMAGIGKEMAADMKAEGVDAIILTSA